MSGKKEIKEAVAYDQSKKTLSVDGVVYSKGYIEKFGDDHLKSLYAQFLYPLDSDQTTTTTEETTEVNNIPLVSVRDVMLPRGLTSGEFREHIHGNRKVKMNGDTLAFWNEYQQECQKAREGKKSGIFSKKPKGKKPTQVQIPTESNAGRSNTKYIPTIPEIYNFFSECDRRVGMTTASKILEMLNRKD